MRDGGDVKDGVEVGQRVVAGVIAERPFLAQRLFGIHVALEHDVRVGRHFQVVGLALDQFDGLLAQVAGEQELVQAVGQRRGGAEGEDGVAPEEHRHRHARAGLVVAPPVPRADLLQLPMHPGGALVIHLHPIHADVALAAYRGPCVTTHGKVMKRPPSSGQHCWMGRFSRVGAGGTACPPASRSRSGTPAHSVNVRRWRPGLGARRPGRRTCG